MTSQANPFVLFEISWEVTNKVGGIHTVISTKAKTATERFGDDYIVIGPWLLTESESEVPFEEELGHEVFCDACRSAGVPVRVGRWLTPGRPRTILVEFSNLYEKKDEILGDLWEDFRVDSISGGWDYVEPVLFGHAAGMVIERWWEEYLAPFRRRTIVHAHEWTTGSAILHLKRQLPSVGTVFTAHSTMLGRTLSSLGHSPTDGLADSTAEELAEEHNIVAKHSIEGVCAREADVFTTVSKITADEAELLHRRRPEPLLPNGIDLDVIDELVGPETRESVRSALVDQASRFLGEDVSDAALVCISGRYQFHNKGIDLLLDALSDIQDSEGKRVVLFVLVPAGNSGVCGEMLERRGLPLTEIDGAIGISTHNLFEEDNDPITRHCQNVGLENAPGSRVKVIHVPIYLGGNDGIFNRPYEAVLRAMDLNCFPSYYEPWGYAPQESLAVGVPTVTSDYAGFGRWAKSEELGTDAGITVLARIHVQYDAVRSTMSRILEDFLAGNTSADSDSCRQTAARTGWSDLFQNYGNAYEAALKVMQDRSVAGVPQTRRPRRTLSVEPAKVSTPRLHYFDVATSLPDTLQSLQTLSRNYWWCWDPVARDLFAELSPRAWERCDHNPVLLLQRVYPQDLEDKAKDQAYLTKLSGALERFRDYMKSETPAYSLPGGGATLSAEHPVAYFSAEFGIHESLSIYSGGLGVLAGDHLKSASDLNLPLVGIGLFYRRGYVNQRLTSSGEQTEVEHINDPRSLPIECIRREDGQPLELMIQLPGRQLYLRAWRAQIGRVKLFLLDADTPSNREEDRAITEKLYGGDQETRILQEIVLGRGGARLLPHVGIQPAVYHMNEGHAAFQSLERVSHLVREQGLTFEAAREYVRSTTLFTTHTPVPAGHDRFGEDLIRRYFSDVEEWVGLPWERFYKLGQAGDSEEFNMTYLALNFSGYTNGVSKMHGVASRKLLKEFWPGLLSEEIPVDTVTNGVHLASWTSPRIGKALGWSAEDGIRGEHFKESAPTGNRQAIWTERSALRAELLAQVRKSLEESFVQRNDSPLTLHKMLEGLDENALLIGFARRFAPYKRAHLLFSDLDRLTRLLDNEERPVRILVSGKAHPADEAGKSILQSIAERTRQKDLIGKVFFIENYDIELARFLVQGVDVWLNTPTHMLEASGTSGMKAAANGVLNLSIGDGWWPEAYDGKNGWRIGGQRVYQEQELQDQSDASALYQLLEEEIVPMFFDRDGDNVPRDWMDMVLHNLATVPAVFNTDRMVLDYFNRAYKQLAGNSLVFDKNGLNTAKHTAREKHRIRRGFSEIKVLGAQMADLDRLKVGEDIDVHLEVDLGSLSAEDVIVELVVGHANGGDDLANMKSVPLQPSPDTSGSKRTFEGRHRIEGSGHFAHGLRIRARCGDGSPGTLRELVFWA